MSLHTRRWSLGVVACSAALALFMGGALAAAPQVSEGPDPPAAVESTIDAAEPDASFTTVSGCERWGARGTAAKPARNRTRASLAVDEAGCPRGCACGRHGRAGRGPGAGMGQGPGRGMQRGHRALMQSAWTLIDGHETIERTVEEIPGGVRTVTITNDPALVAELRKHVREMADLVENGGRIRMWDPLFAELFDHADAITIAIEDVEGGVVVTETSDDPQVAKLIRAHADKVLEFVTRGEEAYREETPLPEDYSPAGR